MVLTSDLIYGFSGALLSARFDEPAPTPQCHREWWELCCSRQKRIAIAAPRGHAKSTAITKAYVLAALLFRDRQFAIIISDTFKQAVLFLGELKRELEANEDLRKLFGVTGFKTDREDDIVVEHRDGHRFRIIALGSEQKVRGLIWDGKRPDLIVGDDLENDEIVMNPDRREKFRNWLFNALLPTLSERGIIRLVGTILHMDSLLERLMPKERDSNTLSSSLKLWMKLPKNGWMAVKYAAHDEAEPLKSKHVLWPEKWSKERLHDVREVFLGQGNPEGYYQEYLNKPIDPSNAYFKKDDFEEMLGDELKLDGRQFTNYLCMDLALTTKERRDYCAFVIGSMDKDGMLYVRHVLKERMDAMQIIDTIFLLYKRYPSDQVVMESGAIEKALGPFLNAEMMRRGIFLPLLTFPSTVEKVQRARSIQARMRAGGVKFDKRKDWFIDLENEMLRFPKDIHDDQVDAMALLGQTLDKMTIAPTNKEIEDEDWMESNQKFIEHDMNQGKSSVCGY